MAYQENVVNLSVNIFFIIVKIASESRVQLFIVTYKIKQS